MSVALNHADQVGDPLEAESAMLHVDLDEVDVGEFQQLGDAARPELHQRHPDRHPAFADDGAYAIWFHASILSDAAGAPKPNRR